MQALGRAQRTSLRDETAAILRRAILARKLRGGVRLNELDLSRQLGVSRGPLREALRELEEKGFVFSTPGQGTFVATVRGIDVIEVLTLRQLVEPFAIELAMAGERTDLVNALSDGIREMRSAVGAKDMPRLIEAHVDFHGLFYMKSHHALLARVWERLRVPLLLYLAFHQTNLHPEHRVVKDHSKLLDLVRRGATDELTKEIRNRLRANLTAHRRREHASTTDMRHPATVIPRVRHSTSVN